MHGAGKESHPLHGFGAIEGSRRRQQYPIRHLIGNMRHDGGPFGDHLACFKSKSRHLAPPVDTQVARRAVVTVLRVDSNGLIWKSGLGKRDMRSDEHKSELQSLMR